MFVVITHGLNAALDGVRGAEPLTFRAVEACLRAVRPVLVAAGCPGEAVAAMAGRTIDRLMDEQVLMQPAAGVKAAAIIENEIHRLPLVRHALKGACSDCGDRHWRVGHAAAFQPLAQPISEWRSAFAAVQARAPFRAAQGLSSCDHHHPALDRKAVRRLLRSLGGDGFGPEPPAGGSLAPIR